MNYSPLKNYEVGLRDRSLTRGVKDDKSSTQSKTDRIARAIASRNNN